VAAREDDDEVLPPRGGEEALEAVVLDGDTVLFPQVERGLAGAQGRKNSAVGTQIVNWSLGRLPPPGTSIASNLGPSSAGSCLTRTLDETRCAPAAAGIARRCRNSAAAPQERRKYQTGYRTGRWKHRRAPGRKRMARRFERAQCHGSAPVRLRAVRRFRGPRNPPAIISSRSQAGATNRERDRGGTIVEDAGQQGQHAGQQGSMPANRGQYAGQQGQHGGPFGLLFPFLGYNGCGP